MLIVFLLQGNAILLCLQSLKKITCFSRYELSFEIWAGYGFSFLAYKTLKAIVTLFFSQFFPIIFFWWKIYFFPAIFFVKALLFVILFGSFFISSWFSATVTEYWKIFCLFYWWDLLLLFLSSQEHLYMIHHDSNLFYDICNTIN